MRVFFRLFFLLFFVLVLGHAQTSQDTIVAYQYYQKADSLLSKRKLDSAKIYFEKALPIYKNIKAWERVVGCYNGISDSQNRSSKFEEALYNANKAIEICKKFIKNNDLPKANTYDNLGNYYRNVFNYEKAEEYYRKSLRIKKSLLDKNSSSLATSYYNLGVISYDTSRYEESLQFFQKSLDIYLNFKDNKNKKISRTYNNMANCYDALGIFEKAIFYYQQAITINLRDPKRNEISLIHNYINIGGTYHYLQRLDEALDFYNKALSIAEKKEYKRGLLGIYANIGLSLQNKGEFEKALLFQKRSLKICSEVLDKNSPYFAGNYQMLGEAYGALGDYDKKLKYLKKGLAIYQSIYQENHYSIADTYLFIGLTYQRKKDYVSANEYYKKALKIYQNIFKEEHPRVSEVYLEIGNLYFEKKEYDLAIKYYKDGIDNLKKIYKKSNYLSTRYYNKLGEVYRTKANYDKALVFFNKAIESNLDNSGIRNQKLDNYFDNSFLLESLINRAKTNFFISIKEKNENKLSSSIKDYKRADSLIDEMRKTYRNYQDKLIFSQKTKDVYHGAIKTQLYLNDYINEQKSINEIFYYVEKGKSNLLKELSNIENANQFLNIPNQLVRLQKKFKTDKAFYRSKVNEEFSKIESDSAKLSKYESKLFDISRKQDSLIQVLEKNYPKYYKLKYQNKVVSVSEVQEKLAKETNLVEFFKTDSTLYTFTISKNDFSVKEFNVPKLDNLIKEFKAALVSKDMQTYKTKAYQLYQKLIEPIRSNLKGEELIIIPDESLWHLNFDLLLTKEEDTSNNPKELPYLLNDYTISYANSATLLFSEEKKVINSEQKLQECLAFSFTDSTNTVDTKSIKLATLRDNGDDLPGTRKEIEAISDIIDGHYFYGSEAVESNFKKNAGQYNILHLALHGEVDSDHPENSKLFFTKTKDTLEDNLLYIHELFALDIPAELTVLSACNTGSGKITRGEGIMSLGTAFQYAGTRSLVLSSWEISDQATPELMKYFYTNLKDGMSKSKALQQAKLTYLNTADPNRIHPFYWGGFYLVGDNSPIEFSKPNYWVWALGLSLLLIVLISFFWNKRKATK